MAWTSPMTAVANAVFTAAQFNTHVRDNLNSTGPALATTAGRYFAVSGVNAIAERSSGDSFSDNSETTGSTSYVDLTTVQSVTLTTGPRALVFASARMENNTANAATFASVAVSGATTTAADDNWLHLRAFAVNQFQRATAANLMFVNAGSNTFTLKFKVSAGTGTFRFRHLIVFPF